MVERAENFVAGSAQRSSRRHGATGNRSALSGLVVGRTEKWPWIRLLFLAALGLVLVVAPWPMGANRIWAWTVLEGLVLGLCLAWCVFCPSNDSLLPLEKRDPLLILMAVWVLYLALYFVPLPTSVVKLLAPDVYDKYAQVYDLMGRPEPYAYLTLDRYLSLQAALKQVMYLSGFLLVVALVNNRARVRFMLFVLLAAGVVEVLIGLGAQAMHIDLVPRKLLDGHWGILRGTYVNRNHFANFLAMTGAAGIGLMVSRLGRSPPESTVAMRIAMWVDRLSEPAFMAAVAGVVLIGAGMILSTSRGGPGALLGALVLVLLLSAITRGRRSQELRLAWPLAGGVAAAVFWAGSRKLIERLSVHGPLLQERWMQWAASKKLIGDFWLTGAGPGLYRYAFTAYKNEHFRPLLYDHAHNDYMELLSNQGIIGAVLAAALVLIIYQRLIRSFTKRSDIVVRGGLFASLTGMTAMLIHSLVGFNFQIPANALYFWILAGVGVAATRLSSARRPSGNSS